MQRIIIVIIAAYVVALLLGRVYIPLLRRLKAGQEIREDGPKWHNSKAGTPTMGGLVFITTMLVMVIASIGTKSHTQLLVLAVALGFGAIGFADDFVKVKLKRNLGLTAIQKLLLQIVMAGVFLYVLYRTGTLTCDLYIPFADVAWKIHPAVYLVFSAVLIVGFVNAVNLTDGIDGLASGVTMPVMVFFTVVAVMQQKLELALFPACLTGGLCGFLFYNYFPAQAFMGDTGSLFLGGAVCGMAFALDMPLVLFLVGIIYLAEAVSVILQVGYFKLTHGKRIFRMTPIHHHFELGGWKEVKIWRVFVGITAAFCVLAYFGVSGRFTV